MRVGSGWRDEIHQNAGPWLAAESDILTSPFSLLSILFFFPIRLLLPAPGLNWVEIRGHLTMYLGIISWSETTNQWKCIWSPWDRLLTGHNFGKFIWSSKGCVAFVPPPFLSLPFPFEGKDVTGKCKSCHRGRSVMGLILIKGYFGVWKLEHGRSGIVLSLLYSDERIDAYTN